MPDTLKRVITLVLLLYAAGVCTAQQQGAELIKKIDSFRTPYNEFLITTRIRSYSNGTLKETALFDAYMNGTEKSLVVQKEGINRRMKILYSNEKLWVQLPSARRPIRITPIQRLMGQASNGDIARVSYGTDYNAANAGTGECSGINCSIIELTARKKSATYHRIMLWARASDLRPVKAEFYLVSGRHFKTAFFDEYMSVGGRSVVKKLTIIDTVRKQSKTTFTYEKIEPKTIPGKYYNKNFLVHVRGL